MPEQTQKKRLPSKTFKQAFREARAAAAKRGNADNGTFKFRGKLYTTKLANDSRPSTAKASQASNKDASSESKAQSTPSTSSSKTGKNPFTLQGFEEGRAERDAGITATQARIDSWSGSKREPKNPIPGKNPFGLQGFENKRSLVNKANQDRIDRISSKQSPKTTPATKEKSSESSLGNGPTADYLRAITGNDKGKKSAPLPSGPGKNPLARTGLDRKNPSLPSKISQDYVESFGKRNTSSTKPGKNPFTLKGFEEGDGSFNKNKKK